MTQVKWAELGSRPNLKNTAVVFLAMYWPKILASSSVDIVLKEYEEKGKLRLTWHDTKNTLKLEASEQTITEKNKAQYVVELSDNVIFETMMYEVIKDNEFEIIAKKELNFSNPEEEEFEAHNFLEEQRVLGAEFVIDPPESERRAGKAEYKAIKLKDRSKAEYLRDLEKKIYP